MGQLKGLSDASILRQIFYLAKLLDMEEHLFKKIKCLSGGNQRKASLSAALLGGPSLLLVDEPTRSLDPSVSREVLLALHFFIHSYGKTLLFSSKKREEVMMIADSVIRLPFADATERVLCGNQRLEHSSALRVRFKIGEKEHETTI